MNAIADWRLVHALKRTAWVAMHRWRFARRLLVVYRWPRFHDRAPDLAQIEAERNATKDMLMDMSRKAVNRPDE